MQEDKQKTTRAKKNKRQGERDKTEAKREKERQRRGNIGANRIKRGANTPKAFYPPNSTRAQKPHKPRKARDQHKPTQNPQNPLKTPLKREIEPYSQAMHQGKSEKAEKGRTRGPQPAFV